MLAWPLRSCVMLGLVLTPLCALFFLEFVVFHQLLPVHQCYPSPLLCSLWPSGFAHCSVSSVTGMEWGCPAKVPASPFAAWLFSSCAYHSGFFPLILCRVSLIGGQSANGPSESGISLDPISWDWWWRHVGETWQLGEVNVWWRPVPGHWARYALDIRFPS